MPYGASDALGALGYALAAEEIVRDCPEVGWIVHASGSAGRQAGLLAGLLALGRPVGVIGVDADVRRIGREAAALLGVERPWTDSLVDVAGAWSAGRYGVADAGTGQAIRLAARLEGLVLDPVCTGKAMAGLIGLAREGRFGDGRPVVWIRTGGGPGIFAYAATMARLSG